MLKINVFRFLIGFIFCFPAWVWANTSQKINTVSSSQFSDNFKFSGYLDGSFNYLVRSNQFTSGVFDRVYDTTPDGFTLQQAALTLAYQPKQGLGALINPVIGQDTNIFAPYGWNPNYGYKWIGFALPQAYVQYIWGKLTFMGGEMLTLASAEGIDPTKDTNFSRSILWGYATPTTALGFRLKYILNDQLTFIAGLNDGWDTIRDFSRRKTIELSAIYQPYPVFSLALTSYSGGQRAIDRTSGGSQSIRNLFDIIATYNATEKLTLVGNYDYGIQPKALLPAGNLAESVWQGLAGYVNYKFNDKWRTSLRGEIFSDRNGYRTGVAQCWKELTLTLGYVPIKNLELRAETRHDMSNVNSFMNADNIGSTNNQQSYALEGLYQF